MNTKQTSYRNGVEGYFSARGVWTEIRTGDKWVILTRNCGNWEDCGEGPFDTRAAALRFANAECGVKFRIARS